MTPQQFDDFKSSSVYPALHSDLEGFNDALTIYLKKYRSIIPSVVQKSLRSIKFEVSHLITSLNSYSD